MERRFLRRDRVLARSGQAGPHSHVRMLALLLSIADHLSSVLMYTFITMV